ncbi:MAG: DNA-binding protein [Planctomycetes bacterium]|nr:DNA-binding protein [Planctomycetota bacterium]
MKDTLPAGLAAPARRALAVAGLKNLDDIARFGEAEIATLHGIGPNALKTIRAALQAAGQTFRQR